MPPHRLTTLMSQFFANHDIRESFCIFRKPIEFEYFTEIYYREMSIKKPGK